MNDPVIRAEHLAKRYGAAVGLAGLDLEVRPGEVYGFVGPNGAGKTTTIRLIMGLLRPTAGQLEIFGALPHRDGTRIRQRIGYLPGDFAVNGRQTGSELLSYLAHLRGGIPASRIQGLAERFGLDLGRRIHSLSKGNRQKLGLVQAFMHRPDLLVLDEPTSALDPLVQQEFVALVRQERDAGRTVFMSSHVLSEVQRTADRVGFIRGGRMVAVESVEQLRDRAVRRVEIQFEDVVSAREFAGLPGVTHVAVEGGVLSCQLRGRADALVKAAGGHTTLSLLSEEPDLEEIFLEYYQEPGAATEGDTDD